VAKPKKPTEPSTEDTKINKTGLIVGGWIPKWPR
jgi:hypothetical protein